MTLHVGVNLLWLVPGVVGGSEEYTTGLLTYIAEQPADDVLVTLFTLEPFPRAYPDLAAAFETVTIGMSGRVKPARVAAESSWLAWQCRRRGVDVVHHAGGALPPLARRPSVLTIHDLQPFVLPDYFSTVKRTYVRWRMPPSVRRARLVMTLTDYTRNAIVERLHVRPERIRLVPPGVLPPTIDPPDVDPRVHYQLDGPFFLYPAITYPHKNHRLLVEAFAAVVREHPDALLVLTGGAAQVEADLAERIIRLGLAHCVRRLGRVPRADLDWLYQQATALTFPSQFEGFGMPVLEAMARGCPVIAADATALPEVVGPAGVLLPSDRPDEWTHAMIELLEDEGRRAALHIAGLARAAEFSWAAAGERLLDAYRSSAAVAGPEA